MKLKEVLFHSNRIKPETNTKRQQKNLQPLESQTTHF